MQQLAGLALILAGAAFFLKTDLKEIRRGSPFIQPFLIYGFGAALIYGGAKLLLM